MQNKAPFAAALTVLALPWRLFLLISSLAYGIVLLPFAIVVDLLLIVIMDTFALVGPFARSVVYETLNDVRQRLSSNVIIRMPATIAVRLVSHTLSTVRSHIYKERLRYVSAVIFAMIVSW
jgi:hypothetical protein